MIVRAVSYAGCGFNGAYYIGTNRVIFSSRNKIFDPKKVVYAGASAGSLGIVIFVHCYTVKILKIRKGVVWWRTRDSLSYESPWRNS